ncbi:antitoxin [Georgenia sp. TF02-10]|uniref:FitA-like ribbon-helix-helix domain-containing protein n=1 Tax=Georgenia sp. TF02-10 TaxID=2917725 RepID=UPI001FA71D0D|nr:antitoxin [Georgenia sp. TF02-10]UNX53271.1 antitoxin [Georgenia sp. TF02-10]
MDLVVRGLPAEVHAELPRRAAAEDKSLGAYLREVLTAHVAVSSMGQWLGRLHELGPNHAGGPTGAELVADARTEDDEPIHR